MVFKSLNLLKEFILSKFISNNSATLRQPGDLNSATLLKVVFFRDTFVLFWSFYSLFSKHSCSLEHPWRIRIQFGLWWFNINLGVSKWFWEIFSWSVKSINNLKRNTQKEINNKSLTTFFITRETSTIDLFLGSGSFYSYIPHFSSERSN